MESDDKTSLDYAKFIIDFLSHNNISKPITWINPIILLIKYIFIIKFNKIPFYDTPIIKNNKIVFALTENEYSSYCGTKICLIYDDLPSFTFEEKSTIINILSKCLSFTTQGLNNIMVLFEEMK